MKNLKVVALACGFAAICATSAMAQTAPVPAEASASSSAAPACVGEKLSSDSLVGDLLDNPDAKAMLVKHVPDLKDNDQIEQARPMTLRSLQAYAPDTFTDKVLADLDIDLATLPVCAAK